MSYYNAPEGRGGWFRAALDWLAEQAFELFDNFRSRFGRDQEKFSFPPVQSLQVAKTGEPRAQEELFQGYVERGIAALAAVNEAHAKASLEGQKRVLLSERDKAAEARRDAALMELADVTSSAQLRAALWTSIDDRLEGVFVHARCGLPLAIMSMNMMALITNGSGERSLVSVPSEGCRDGSAVFRFGPGNIDRFEVHSLVLTTAGGTEIAYEFAQLVGSTSKDEHLRLGDVAGVTVNDMKAEHFYEQAGELGI